MKKFKKESIIKFAPAAIVPRTTGDLSLNTLVTNILTLVYMVVGVIALLAIIYGGFMFMTAGGDAEKTTKAKNIILYAVLGVLVVALAAILVSWASGNLANFFTGSGPEAL